MPECHSYGTLIGRRYAGLYPHHLRALALDSAMDPARPDAQRFLMEGTAAADDAVQQLANWCSKDASCALKGKEVKAVVRQLFTRADNGTLVDPGPHGPTRKKVTADQLAGFLSSYLNKWNPQTTAEQLAALQSGKGKVSWIDDTPELAWRSVVCRDFDFRLRDYADYRALLQQATSAHPQARYNAQALDMIVGCQGWPAAPKPQPAQNKGPLPPVLVVNAKPRVFACFAVREGTRATRCPPALCGVPCRAHEARGRDLPALIKLPSPVGNLAIPTSHGGRPMNARRPSRGARRGAGPVRAGYRDPGARAGHGGSGGSVSSAAISAAVQCSSAPGQPAR
ncbi:alpha/beta fold hydrolase [Streptomyces sp. NRRL S-1813]|uniref:alpha/beta fold hydrolase n=1 Tax=Streptomyces sp. NRRL S-1813 TaxID=1463888 RepID=UPI0006907425|nr:alpha/beta fold hydrolase [Streptomyces sp. NRRL S-1813]